MDNYIGKRLDGRYEITELIGQGGMANVYKATDVLDNRIVAVKILKREFSEMNFCGDSGMNPRQLLFFLTPTLSRFMTWDFRKSCNISSWNILTASP